LISTHLLPLLRICAGFIEQESSDLAFLCFLARMENTCPNHMQLGGQPQRAGRPTGPSRLAVTDGSIFGAPARGGKGDGSRNYMLTIRPVLFTIDPQSFDPRSRGITPNRTRTGVFWLRTRHPRPLDDGGRFGYCAELGGSCQGNRQRIALAIVRVRATLLATNAYRSRISLFHIDAAAHLRKPISCLLARTCLVP
jgi:hypothetical protein